MARDTQRSKLYAAERQAFGIEFDHTEGSGIKALGVEQAQALIEKWGESKVLRRRYPRAGVPVEVRDGRGHRRAVYYASYMPTAMNFMLAPRPVIHLPAWARTKPVLLHEWAHHLTHEQGAAHGHEFAACYLYLVRVFIGKWAAEKLEAEFRAGKVRWRKPRTVTMSEADRAKRAERMKAINDRRAVERSLAYLEGAADGAHRPEVAA